jgi:hypothetical protein
MVAAHNVAMECFRHSMLDEQTFEGVAGGLCTFRSVNPIYNYARLWLHIFYEDAGHSSLFPDERLGIFKRNCR